jgi:hypothetical protein
MEQPNYLASVPNPFNLVGPPKWFQRAMRAQDAELVIFPSQEEGVYRVARRVPHGHVSRFSLRFVQHRPDTKTYIDHGLAPVTSLLPFVQWSPVILSDLAEMDMQRFGGAAKAADELERQELEAEQKTDLDIADAALVRAGDFYRSAKYTAGQTVFQSETRGRTRTRRRTVPAYRPLDFAGGSAVFVGR